MAKSPSKSQIFQFTDACYALQCTDDEWLTALTQEALPFLDYGRGVAAWGFRKGEWTSGEVPIGVDPALGKAMWGAASRYSPEDITQLFLAARATSATERIGNTEGLDRHPASTHFADVGVKDFHALTVWDSAGRGVALAGASSKVLRAPRGQVARLERLGAHLLAGFRLRQALRQVDAVLEPGGRLVHAEHEAREDQLRDALSRAVRNLDHARSLRGPTDADESLEAFEGLVAGRWSIVENFESDGRRYLVAVRNQPGQIPAAALSPHESHALALRAQGLAYKVIGYELGIGSPAAFTATEQGMKKLGIPNEADLPLFFRAAVAAEVAKAGAKG